MEEKAMVVGIEIEKDSRYNLYSCMEDAKLLADEKLKKIEETTKSIKEVKPECDKLDYALAAGVGLLSGLIDIFLVGSPEDSYLCKMTDKWFEGRVQDFAKLNGWKGEKGDNTSAIRFLENKFKVPYDQTGLGDAGKEVFNLTPSNHHFKSLGHNPTILGMFFSILDQFNNTSHFVTGGEIIELVSTDDGFELRGNDFGSKITSGIVNWFRTYIIRYFRIITVAKEEEQEFLTWLKNAFPEEKIEILSYNNRILLPLEEDKRQSLQWEGEEKRRILENSSRCFLYRRGRIFELGKDCHLSSFRI